MFAKSNIEDDIILNYFYDQDKSEFESEGTMYYVLNDKEFHTLLKLEAQNIAKAFKVFLKEHPFGNIIEAINFDSFGSSLVDCVDNKNLTEFKYEGRTDDFFIYSVE